LMSSHILFRTKVDKNGGHFIVGFTPFNQAVMWALLGLISLFLATTWMHQACHSSP
jgi:hypothetical protein